MRPRRDDDAATSWKFMWYVAHDPPVQILLPNKNETTQMFLLNFNFDMTNIMLTEENNQSRNGGGAENQIIAKNNLWYGSFYIPS